MNPLKHLFLSLVILLTSGVFLNGQQVVLSIDNALIHKTSATGTSQVVFNVQEKRSNCIQLYGSNPGKPSTTLNTGSNTMSNPGTADILCTALLNSVEASSGGRRYEFSPGCAENSKTSASVRVVFSNLAPSTPVISPNQTAFILNVADSEILSVSGNETPVGPTNARKMLKVNASVGNTATISINLDDNRGQCFIAIVGSQGTLAILDPKSSSNLSFSVNQAVYVVPVLKPKVQRSQDGANELIYEIGDPERNGKVRVEEI